MKEFLINIKNHLEEYVIFGIALLAPIYPAMITIGVLLAFDLIAGIMAARKKGEKITSRKMSMTASKILLYNMIIISGFLVEHYILNWVPIVKIATGFLAIVELKSLSENIGSITGVNIWSAIKVWFKRRKEDVGDIITKESIDGIDGIENLDIKDKSDK